MEKKEAEETITALVTRAKELLVENSGIEPVAFLLIGTQFAIVPMKFRNDQEKDAHVALVKLLANVKGADAVVFISEAWCVVRGGDLPKPGEFPRASLAPDRKECIVASIVTRTGYEGAMTIPFDRDDNQKPVFVDNPDLPAGLFSTAISMWSDTFTPGFGIGDMVSPPEGTSIQ